MAARITSETSTVKDPPLAPEPPTPPPLTAQLEVLRSSQSVEALMADMLFAICELRDERTPRARIEKSVAAPEPMRAEPVEEEDAVRFGVDPSFGCAHQ